MRLSRNNVLSNLDQSQASLSALHNNFLICSSENCLKMKYWHFVCLLFDGTGKYRIILLLCLEHH